VVICQLPLARRSNAALDGGDAERCGVGQHHLKHLWRRRWLGEQGRDQLIDLPIDDRGLKARVARRQECDI